MTSFDCLRFETPPNLDAQVPVFISPRNRVARLYPQALSSLFIAPYNSQGYGGGIRLRLHTGYWLNVSNLMLRATSVSQSLLEYCSHLRVTTRFFITVRLLRVCWCGCWCGELMWVSLSLSEERTGLSFTIAAGPRQGSHSQVRIHPVGLATIFYCPGFETSILIASYDSKIYGGSIRPHLHTGDWLKVILYPLATPRHGPRRKHGSSFLGVQSLPWEHFVCEAVTQQRPY
jgi:hypothetical protein